MSHPYTNTLTLLLFNYTLGSKYPFRAYNYAHEREAVLEPKAPANFSTLRSTTLMLTTNTCSHSAFDFIHHTSYTVLMDRINIYIPRDLRQQIKLRAEQAKKPEAEVIRALLAKAVEADNAVRPRLTNLAHLGLTGPSDLATNLDSYLYADLN